MFSLRRPAYRWIPELIKADVLFCCRVLSLPVLPFLQVWRSSPPLIGRRILCPDCESTVDFVLKLAGSYGCICIAVVV